MCMIAKTKKKIFYSPQNKNKTCEEMKKYFPKNYSRGQFEFWRSWVDKTSRYHRQLKILKMSSENISSVSTFLSSIETDYEESRTLNNDMVKKFFEELLKLENGTAAVKEFTWLFGIGENERHIVESKECRKVYLVDFKTCRKYLSKFLTEQD